MFLFYQIYSQIIPESTTTNDESFQRALGSMIEAITRWWSSNLVAWFEHLIQTKDVRHTHQKPIQYLGIFCLQMHNVNWTFLIFTVKINQNKAGIWIKPITKKKHLTQWELYRKIFIAILIHSLPRSANLYFRNLLYEQCC